MASTAMAISKASVASSGVGGLDGELLSAESAEDSGFDPPLPRELDHGDLMHDDSESCRRVVGMAHNLG